MMMHGLTNLKAPAVHVEHIPNELCWDTHMMMDM